MKDINQLKDYRKKYKRYYGIEFGSEYAVHHIDFDRSNNNIENLLLLPRGLHNKYHMCLDGCSNNEHMINGIITDLPKYKLTSMLHLVEALTEIQKWVKWKSYNYDEYLKNFIFNGSEEYEV